MKKLTLLTALFAGLALGNISAADMMSVGMMKQGKGTAAKKKEAKKKEEQRKKGGRRKKKTTATK